MKNPMAILVALVIIFGAVALNTVISQKVSTHIDYDRGANLTELSKGMASRLGNDMNTRAGEIEFLTGLANIADQTVPLEEKRDLFEAMKKSYPYYAWIGLTDSEGNILTGTDGLLVGKNVSKREWFIKGSMGLHFGDAHDAFLLAKLMPKPKYDDLPLRLVDVSAPVRDADGKLLGVICGHLSIDWAFEARNNMIGQQRVGDYDLVVLNEEGNVLMGTPFLPSLKTDLSQLKTWKAIASGEDSSVMREEWNDGNNYMTAIASSDFLQSRLPIKWSILARETKENQLELTNEIKTSIWLISAIILILSILVIQFLGRKKQV